MPEEKSNIVISRLHEVYEEFLKQEIEPEIILAGYMAALGRIQVTNFPGDRAGDKFLIKFFDKTLKHCRKEAGE